MRDIIASELLSGLGDVVGEPGDKLQNIPAHHSAKGSLSPGWTGSIDNLPTFLVPLEPLQHDRTSNHIASDPGSLFNGIYSNRRVNREALHAS